MSTILASSVVPLITYVVPRFQSNLNSAFTFLLCNLFVVPVLFFKAGAWRVCERVIKKIEMFHRKQLRRVLVLWPFKISNKNLKEKFPPGQTIRRLLWNLFGHVLRLSLDTPAQMVVDYYCNSKEAT
jgi:hypothetical protein